MAHLERRPQKAIPVWSGLGSNGPRPEAISPPTHRPRPQAMHTTHLTAPPAWDANVALGVVPSSSPPDPCSPQYIAFYLKGPGKICLTCLFQSGQLSGSIVDVVFQWDKGLEYVFLLTQFLFVNLCFDVKKTSNKHKSPIGFPVEWEIIFSESE